MGGIFLLIFLIIGIVALLAGVILLFTKKWRFDSEEPGPYFFVVGLVLSVLFGIIVLFNCFVVIDASEVGVEVLWGKVQERTLTEGWQGKSLFSEVITYNIRLKQYTMSIATGEGDRHAADGVSIRTSDNSQMTADATVWWAIDPSSAFNIYKKISRDEDGIQKLIIRPSIRTSMRDMGANYTLDSIMKERLKYGMEVYDALVEMLEGKGVIIDKVLIREIAPPSSVDTSIQAKLSTEQDLAAMEFKLENAKKEAAIQIVQAQGIADSQDIIQRKLTPLYVQYLAVTNYAKMAESNNTTFIIAPTSPNGTGMPIIIDGK